MTEESIYNLVPKPPEQIQKKKMYRSKCDPRAPLTGSTFGLRGTTATVGKGLDELKKTCVVNGAFGPMTRVKTTPSNFLRKGSRPNPNVRGGAGGGSSTKEHETRRGRKNKNDQKPPIPCREDRPVMGLRTEKNFITANAVEAILSEARRGEKEDEDFMKVEGYGRVPGYLGRVKDEVARENEMIDRYVREELADENDDPVNGNGHGGVEMDEGERMEVVDKLKEKWDEVNSKYQKFCHRVTFEGGDIRRKEALEAALEQLDKDITMLSRPGPVVIIQS